MAVLTSEKCISLYLNCKVNPTIPFSDVLKFKNFTSLELTESLLLPNQTPVWKDGLKHQAYDSTCMQLLGFIFYLFKHFEAYST